MSTYFDDSNQCITLTLAYLDVRLCSEVVDFRRPNVADDLDEAVAVNQIAVVQNHPAFAMAFRILVQMLQRSNDKTSNWIMSLYYCLISHFVQCL